MKSLKFDHKLAEMIRDGIKTSTWRIFDDKDITVGDRLILIDKVDSRDRNTWAEIGIAKVDRIVEKSIGQIDDNDMDGHEQFSSKKEMRKTYDEYYGTVLPDDTIVKIIHFHLVPDASATDSDYSGHGLKLFADGGSRGNPGPSASGFVLFDTSDNVVKKSGQYLGITTNNQAEYQALKLGLEAALELRASEVSVYLDSLLVVNQMLGIYKIKNPDLWPIHASIVDLTRRFARISFTHIPRELNKLADSEVNLILDEHMST